MIIIWWQNAVFMRMHHVFLLFYQYLCLKHGDSLEEVYKPGELVKMAIRGKLQVASFLKFMESASSFLHLLNKDFQLTEFSFYKSLERVHSLEKQKSYARFFRKFLKKIDGWDCKEELLRQYPKLFVLLIAEFAKLKKDTYISEELSELYHKFFCRRFHKKKGKCKITVTSIYDSKVKGTLSLTVSKGKQKAKITLKEKKASIVVGKTTTIKVKSFKGISNKNIAFSSSDKKVATVSSKGKVTGKKAGKATITVTSLINKNVKAKFTITVKTADMIDTDYSEKGKGKIVLEEDNVVLYPEKSFHKIYDHCGDAHSLEYYTEDHESMDQFIGEQLLVQKEKYGQAQIKVKRITGVKNSAVSYKSSNTSVAAVSSTGFVTPKKVGTATITVTSKANKKVQAKYKVTVKKNDMVLAVGFDMYDNIKYYVKKNDDGTIENRSMVVSTEFFSADKKVAESCDYSYNIASNNKIIMTSSNENVLRVTADERLEVIGRGSSIITLKTADGRWSYSWKVTVSDKQTSFSKYVTGFRTGKGMDEDDEKYGFVTKL